ncbi:MAG: NADH-ubiquinone oxidoreductase-F iron-sulfur binding region domain-containing protein, partial [Ktedonobacterales bacterium]
MPDTSQTANLLLGGLDMQGSQQPLTLDAYRQQGGYAALRKALSDLSPAQVIGQISDSGLRGRGGAGVLAAEKLKLVARADSADRYLVCNAYDADDRSLISATLLARNPHAVLEGMALAAYAIGAHEGYLYVRSSRTAGAEAVQAALAEALGQGLLGRGALGSSFDFAITVVGVERGFMAGEESSLLEILKGRPMKAQQRPPYPTDYGVHDKPTAVQNVETLANLPVILGKGVKAFRAVGTATTPGTKLVTVLGPGAATGRLIEIPFGATLAQVLRQAGLDVNESSARGVVVGGREGGVLPLAQLNTPFDFEALEEIGAIVGSSVIEALATDTCMVHWAMEQSDYLAEASCGKCVPCRVGVKRIAGTLSGIVSDLGKQDDLALLDEFAHYVP